MPSARAIALILALAALPPQEGGAQDPAPAGAPPAEDAPEREDGSASDALARVEELVAEAWFVRHPSLARHRGLPAADLEPLRLGIATRLAWRRVMQRAAGDLAAVEVTALDDLRRADRAWLARFIDTERALDALVPEERWNPGVYLDEAVGVLAGLAGAMDLAADARLGAVTMHLGRLRETLESAREDLGDPSPQACALSLFQAERLVELLSGGLDRTLEPARPAPELWRSYDGARNAALEAAVAFRAWIRAEAKRKRPARVLGATGWRTVVSGRSGLALGGARGTATAAKLDLQGLKARLLRDIAALDADLREHRVPPAPAPDALDPARVETRVREALVLGWEEARRLGVVEDALPGIEVRVRPAQGAPGPPLEVAWGEPIRLDVLAPNPGWTENERVRRAFELSPAAQRAAALRYGWPGEGLWEAWTRASERTAQRALWNRVQREGWGLYAAEWAVRGHALENPLAEDVALAREVARARLSEAVRAYAALSLHAGGESEQEVARRIRAFVPITPASAELETRLVLLDPLRGAGYLAYLRLKEVEAALRERFGVESATWAVARLLRLCPSTPTDAMLDRLPDLGEPPAPPEPKDGAPEPGNQEEKAQD